MNNPLHSSFVYFSCQHGAEATIKAQLCEPLGPFRLSFSQKGFVTLKSELVTPAWSRPLPQSPLIRACGHALDKFESENSTELIEQILSKYLSADWDHLHVWQRDVAQPGWNGFEPGRSPLAEVIAEQFQKSLAERNDPRSKLVNGIAAIGTKLLEVILNAVKGIPVYHRANVGCKVGRITANQLLRSTLNHLDHAVGN